MRFTLVDRIIQCEPGKLLRAEKYLTRAEEYLADHFPSFPVMPGVMMLEALVESGAWLWRVSNDFNATIIVLREAKNVKYGTFMEPGKTLSLSVELLTLDGNLATFRGTGTTEGGAQTVSARFTLAASNVRDRSPHGAAIDERLTIHWKERYLWLTGQMLGKG